MSLRVAQVREARAPRNTTLSATPSTAASCGEMVLTWALASATIWAAVFGIACSPSWLCCGSMARLVAMGRAVNSENYRGPARTQRVVTSGNDGLVTGRRPA
jgi:hypothetical protein